MRFLISFIISGLIYYALYHYTPEVFSKLVGITDSLFQYAEAFFSEIASRVKGSGAAQQMLPMLAMLRRR